MFVWCLNYDSTDVRLLSFHAIWEQDITKPGFMRESSEVNAPRLLRISFCPLSSGQQNLFSFGFGILLAIMIAENCQVIDPSEMFKNTFVAEVGRLPTGKTEVWRLPLLKTEVILNCFLNSGCNSDTGVTPRRQFVPC
jgi:hypothetical protein